MPNTDNEPQIPKNQSSITDSRTGLVSRDWYRFFLNLLNKANEGGNAGLGTVTSVSVSGGTTGLTTSGSPITTSGTITIAGTLDVDNGGTGATTSAAALSNLGAYPASNPNGYNSGTVTSVGATVPAFLSVSGSPVTTTGTLAITYSGTGLPVANGGTGATIASTARSNLSAAQSGANTDITSIALTTGTITTAPSGNDDIVNKFYADSIVNGVNFHAACNYATAAALAANTYNNGSSGVGATLTAVAVGTLTVDGYTFVVGDVGKRILVKNEVTGANNGVYTLTQAGTALLPYILTRATDYDTSGTGTNEIDVGDLLLVLSGTANANTSWVQQTPLPITVGTTAIVFVQFAAVQTYSAGTGLSLASNTFSIANTGTAGTYGSASVVPVFVTNAQGQVTSVTNTTIAIAGSAVTGNISGNAANVTGTVAVANGGTGLTTTPANGALDIGNGTGFTRTTLTPSTGITVTNASGSITIANSLPMTYPGAGIPNSTGTAWGTSYTTTGSGTVVALATSPSFTTPILGTPTSGNFSTGTFTWPTFNQNTTGTASNVTGTVAVANGGTGLTTAPTNGQIDIGSTGVGFVRTTLTAGSGISVTNAAGSVTITNTSPSSGGTVTSVTGTAPVSVATGTTTPVISLAASYGDTQNPYASKTAKFVLAAPNAAAGVPTFRAIVASDIPTLNQNTTGTASNVTGTVAIANGGTGQTTAVTAFDALSPTTTKGDLIVSNGTDNVRQAVGTDTYVLIADSTQTSGVKWGPVSISFFTASENITAPNATVPVDALTVANASADVDVVLAAKGTGATLAQIPDSLTSGGNKRGTYATDWQKIRSAANQVASGIYSTVSGGRDNQASNNYSSTVGGFSNTSSGSYATSGGYNCIASGQYSVALGYSHIASDTGSVALGYNCNADGAYSFTTGHNADARVRYSVFAISSEAIASTQPTQTTIQTVGKQTTTATPATLTALSSGTTFSYQNRMDINSAYAFKIMVVANVTGGGNTKAWELTGCIKRGASGAPTIVGAITKTIIAADTGTSAWDVSVVIDTDAFSVQATGAAATTIRWAASIYCAEVEF
jgi:hypothetical protein